MYKKIVLQILLIIMQVEGLSAFRTFISSWRVPKDYRPRNRIQIFGEKKFSPMQK
jgi:hypothetical protein